MIIFYNWKKLLYESGRSNKRLVDIIEYITYKPLIDNHDSKFFRYSFKALTGDSFLSQPELLLNDRPRLFDREIVEYIGLASYRNYPEYKTTGKLTLDLLAFREKEALINSNSLLRIVGNQIQFKYEEALKGETTWL